MRREPISHHPAADRARPARDAAGFTIIELLTAVAIVIVILSIVVVAVNSAVRGAQRTNTQSLMTAISQGLIQFRQDTGYFPPVLDTDRNIYWDNLGADGRMNGPLPNPDANSDYRDEIQRWYSITTLADYLVGYGPVEEASTPGEFWSPDGYAGPGIRNPGPDGYWALTTDRSNLQADPGTFEARLEFLDPDGNFGSQSRRFREGPVLGPYVQLRDERLLAAINPEFSEPDEETGQYRVVFPGEAGYDPDFPKVIVDYWGQPIRYYRLPYPQGRPDTRYRRVSDHPVFGDPLWSPPSLSHVIALRPFLLDAGEDIDAPAMLDEPFEDDFGDTTTSRPLQAGEFALLSAGPNRTINVRARVDDEELNRGNLVEVGP